MNSVKKKSRIYKEQYKIQIPIKLNLYKLNFLQTMNILLFILF